MFRETDQKENTVITETDNGTLYQDIGLRGRKNANMLYVPVSEQNK